MTVHIAPKTFEDANDPNQWLAQALVADDIAYFEAGATVDGFAGGQLTWLNGYTDLDVGCVVHVGDADIANADPAAWIANAEAAQRARRAAIFRVYDPSLSTSLASAFRQRGYSHCRELLMTLRASEPLVPCPIHQWQIEPLRTSACERAKLELLRNTGVYPDGKSYAADRWMAVEAIKASTGYFQLYLVWEGKRAIGSFGLSRRGSVVRLKNLLIAADRQRHGVGAAVMAFAQAAAGSRVLGALAVEGSIGARAYLGYGLQIVGHIDEWRKPVEAP